jgi:hypothetical protein
VQYEFARGDDLRVSEGHAPTTREPKEGAEMIKKVLATVGAAVALSVSLAGVAGADPGLDNPGTPGHVGMPPGQAVSTAANAKPQGTSITDLARAGGYRSIGNAINTFAPGHNK